jgi:hypothetical protein
VQSDEMIFSYLKQNFLTPAPMGLFPRYTKMVCNITPVSMGLLLELNVIVFGVMVRIKQIKKFKEKKNEKKKIENKLKNYFLIKIN